MSAGTGWLRVWGRSGVQGSHEYTKASSIERPIDLVDEPESTPLQPFQSEINDNVWINGSKAVASGRSCLPGNVQYPFEIRTRGVIIGTYGAVGHSPLA
jgi:hypothetical protein